MISIQNIVFSRFRSNLNPQHKGNRVYKESGIKLSPQNVNMMTSIARTSKDHDKSFVIVLVNALRNDNNDLESKDATLFVQGKFSTILTC